LRLQEKYSHATHARFSFISITFLNTIIAPKAFHLISSSLLIFFMEMFELDLKIETLFHVDAHAPYFHCRSLYFWLVNNYLTILILIFLQMNKHNYIGFVLVL